MILALLLQAAERPVDLFWGFVVPGSVFAISFFVTWLLYRHFSKQQQG